MVPTITSPFGGPRKGLLPTPRGRASLFSETALIASNGLRFLAKRTNLEIIASRGGCPLRPEDGSWMTLRLALRRRILWEYLLEPLLGPFSAPLRRHIAIKEANQSFGHVRRFIAECNESLARYMPPGLANSWGVSLAEWSREGNDIVSNLRLKTLRKKETIIPIRITVGTEQVKIGDELMLLSDSETILNSVSRKVSDFFST